MTRSEVVCLFFLVSLPTAIHSAVVTRALHHPNKLLKVDTSVTVNISLLSIPLSMIIEGIHCVHLNQIVTLLLADPLAHIHHHVPQFTPRNVSVTILRLDCVCLFNILMFKHSFDIHSSAGSSELLHYQIL